MPAKFNFLVAASIPAVALIPLLACGGGSSGGKDAPIVIHDSPGSGSGSATCTFQTTFTPTFTAQGTRYTASGSGTNPIPENKLDWDGLFHGSAGGSDEQILRVLIFGGCGATGTGCTGGSAANKTPDWPTAFGPKTGVDITNNDVILVLLADPGATSYNTIYFGDMGTINVTAAADGSGHAFSGNGSGIHFTHIDASFNPAADGCVTTVPSFSWAGSAFDGKVFQGKELNEDTINYLRRRTL